MSRLLRCAKITQTSTLAQRRRPTSIQSPSAGEAKIEFEQYLHAATALEGNPVGEEVFHGGAGVDHDT